MRFPKLSVMMIQREKKRKRMDGKNMRKNKRMRMDDNIPRCGTKDNFSVMESMAVEQAPKKSLILLPDLPNDLLGLIICNLDLVDRYHLGLVCKRFSALIRSATGIISAKTKFGVTCLLLLAMDRKTCSLRNPQHQEEYIINTPSLPANAEILCAKDGWLLMAVKDQNSVFFFNPLTKATIRLPDLTNIHLGQCFSFSCPPTSPNCIVVATRCVRSRALFKICCRGDKLWRGRICYMGNPRHGLFDSTEAVFYRGSLFCLRNDGRLGIFDPVKLTWAACSTKIPKSDTFPYTPPICHYLIEFEGQLLRVSRGLRAADSSKKKKLVLVHNLLEGGRTGHWNIDNLGDNTLYVSRIASLSSKAFSANRRGKICTRSLRDFNDDIYHPDGCWIEPHCARSSPEELQWISKT